MKKSQKIVLVFLFFFSCSVSSLELFAQEGIIPSLKFKDADIRVVLQAIAQKAVKNDKEINILLCPEVKGLVNVDLSNVDWETALDAVLKTYNYGYEWVGANIILVDTLESLTEKRKRTQEAKIAEPLETKTFVLSFAKVSEIEGTIQKMLSSRGRLTYDKRTNALVITDTQSNLSGLEKAINTLDTITPQVLIEAKIIETSVDVANKIGIDWTIQGGASGAKRPHTWPFTSSTANKYAKSDAFPAATDLLFSFGTLNASSLQATLEVIFSDTDTNILSMPKVTTLDNYTAMIDVSTTDPVPNYTYNQESGFWEISGFDEYRYGISLEVTPQINREGFITLTVNPKVDEKLRDKTFTSVSGLITTVPVLSTQTTTTKVMIKNGETLVIAGLIRDKKIDIVKKVPILGDIPILGYLFKHKDKTTEKKNLLIFITATIITPERVLAEK